ncbi:hypothetical protein [Nostoc sp. DSM 114167]|jgi:hypothetical protein|uniref:hypothetical protein n=1 Tax=Nostoc sp. DSM 114167 TaxID=3439050 RepID=UPI004045C12D
MEKKVLSFRVSEAEITAIESFQQPEDSSLGQTALRLLRSLIGVQPDTTVNAVDTHEIKDRVESLEERLNGAIITREQLSDFVNDIVDKRIHHLVNALSDHENRLLGIEQAQEKQSPTPVTAEVTTQDVVLSLLQDKEDAIAPEATEENVVSAPTGKKISPKKLKSIATSIQNTFKGKGIEISQTIIKNKILEMYPNPNDWLPHSDARRDLIRALEKEHK